VREARTALRKYVTQMHVMDWFLDGFARQDLIKQIDGIIVILARERVAAARVKQSQFPR
jgi:hypothetical protein